MVTYQAYSHPEIRRYKAHLCSKASLFVVFIFLMTFIPPYLVVYKSYGFWKKVDNYIEQPRNKFLHDAILLIGTSKSGDYLAWSTYPNFNVLQQSHLRVPVIKSREVDTNRDGIKDYLNMNIQVPLLDTEQVYSVQLVLLFYTEILMMSQNYLTSLVYITHESFSPGAMFSTFGDLKVSQRRPVAHWGVSRIYEPSPITDSVNPESFDLNKIFFEYAQRNLTMTFNPQYPIWQTGRGAGQPFVINATIFYPEQTIEFRPGFWQTIKWAAIQYIPVLLIFLFVFNKIKWFFFENQLVPTVVDRPKLHQH